VVESIHEFDDVWMIELPERFGFTAEAFEHLGIRGHLTGQDFDCYVLTRLVIGGKVDFTHTALAEKG
jgi:hypothetical protein